ncbi:MAG: methyltransferase family protein [Candidatus Hermodarchaeota archaeon]
MVELMFLKMFFLLILIAHFIVFTVPLILIRLKGADPHGIHQNYSILARLSPISYFLLVIYVILYIFFNNMIQIFWTIIFLSGDVIIITGMIFMIIGLVLEILGIINLGINFRIEIPKDDTKLITSGIYRLMRNPIAFSLYLYVIGVFLITPNIISLIIFIMNIITFNAKIAKEEIFLLERFGYEYEQYMNRVGRYLPFTFKKHE